MPSNAKGLFMTRTPPFRTISLAVVLSMALGMGVAVELSAAQGETWPSDSRGGSAAAADPGAGRNSNWDWYGSGVLVRPNQAPPRPWRDNGVGRESPPRVAPYFPQRNGNESSRTPSPFGVPLNAGDYDRFQEKSRPWGEVPDHMQRPGDYNGQSPDYSYPQHYEERPRYDAPPPPDNWRYEREESGRPMPRRNWRDYLQEGQGGYPEEGYGQPPASGYGDPYRERYGDPYREGYRQPSGQPARQPSRQPFRQPSREAWGSEGGNPWRDGAGDNWRQPPPYADGDYYPW